ncbi:putative F-box domain-containing protein [Helianthus annuus]|uniref:F-box domain-containing protein n=1 Tax=Helianthus annuus TaxID=4232 RepID=A0A251TVT5_HELAN|nr:F-box/kelch-repeat protein At3g06240 [Helianthus annuus]KAF5791011.1 putative F-box domain-containing protein [Helianthus annuus]KAJ0526138.1 putative F-box domain-containing protein [Helianthus annuus]KAJ0542530.1 putative F-box domain-containing protein [Helianthus annuus]KAJ0707577.1 putative F-box domain-containing protein [Helianthus annuus]KAJ0711579.1 putative F-box domain-containing protein [Helianthus annuus]
MSTSSGKSVPPEITQAILRRLPVKSLGRFKSVSKTWNSLISDPHFIKTHLRQTRKLIVGSGTSLYSIDMNQLLPYLNINTNDIPVTGKVLNFRSPPIQWVEILGTCMGLVLARDDDDTIFLMNPTTQVLWKLPVSPFALPVEDDKFLGKWRAKFFVRYGFGYDSANDDFKVVSISFWNPESGLDPECTDTFVRVYSLRNNSWSKLPNSRYDHGTFYAVSGALVNQNYHWLVSRSTIVGFSFTEEEFSEIRLPGSIEKAGFFDVVDMNGKLGVFVGVVEVGFELWVMEEYGVSESWRCMVSYNGFGSPVRPVCLVEGSNRDIVFEDLGRVLVYNIDQRRCRNVRMVGGPRRLPVGLGGTCYVETLESPKPPHALSSRDIGAFSNLCKSKLTGWYLGAKKLLSKE